MNSLSQLIAIGTVSALAAGGTWLVKGPPEEKVFHCDPSAIPADAICLADVSGKVLWIDARPRAEWEENGVSGSILWNMDPQEDQSAFEAETAMAAIEAELVVVYCSSEACGTSRQIADRIREFGLGPEVKVLHGGWDALKGTAMDSSSKP